MGILKDGRKERERETSVLWENSRWKVLSSTSVEMENCNLGLSLHFETEDGWILGGSIKSKERTPC